MENKKKAIVEAAFECFAKQGYANTSVDDIVRYYGKSKGSIYYYFKSKEEIFQALFDEILIVRNNAVKNLTEKYDKIEDFFEAYLSGFFKFLKINLNFFIVTYECFVLSRHNEKMLDSLMNCWESMLDLLKKYEVQFESRLLFEQYLSIIFSCIDGMIRPSVLFKKKVPLPDANIIVKSIKNILKSRYEDEEC